MIPQDLVGRTLVDARARLDEAGVPYQVRFTRALRPGADDSRRNSRVIAIKEQTLLVGGFLDTVKGESFLDE